MQELERLLRLITTSDQGTALYAVVALAAAIDAFPSLIPSQTILVTAVVLSARPDGPSIWLLLVAGACGAIAGDNAMYWLGRAFGEQAVQRLAKAAEEPRRSAGRRRRSSAADRRWWSQDATSGAGGQP